MPRAPGRPVAADGLRRAGAGFAGRPLGLPQLALAWLAGNLVLHQLAALPEPLLLLALALLALGGAARFGLRRASWPLFAALAFCWTGFAAEQSLAHRWPAADDGRDLRLSGWVDSVPTRDAGRTVFSLRVVVAATDSPPRRVRLSWYDPAPRLEAGQALAVVARIRTPRGLANPGGFDYERWLFLEGYDATGYVREGMTVARSGINIAREWLKFRVYLAARIEALVSDPDAAALIRALSLGDRGGFDTRHWMVLQRTGTSHLVAVSGLHIGLIAAFAYLLGLKFMLRLPYPCARHAHTFAAVFCIVPAGAYAAVAGFGLPTRRALLMLLVAQLLVIVRRRWPGSAALGLALILVLLLDPLASLTASFWLSFGAVSLLLAAAVPAIGPSPRGSSRLLRGLAGFCRLQWALTLGLAPLVIWFFGQVSLASIAVNLVAIPLFSLVLVPLSLVATGLASLTDNGAGIVWFAGAAAGWAWRGLEWIASRPYSAIELARPSIAALVLALSGILLCIPRHGLPGRRLALLALVPLVVGTRTRLEAGEARVTVFDVGHGLAVAVETAAHRLLYDAGPVFRSGFDAGAEIVGPALAALSAKPLDRIVISHADSDHAGGVASIMARYPEARILAGPDVELPAAETCRAGMAWVWDEVRFTILHPPQDFRPPGNETSCVLRVETVSGALLLTGDIERRAETALLSDMRLAAAVVVVPHHGSLTSSAASFVTRVAPRIAIVSAGFNNRWDFPRPEVRDRWESEGALLLVTGDDGAIDIDFASGSIAVALARDQQRRYWHADRDPVSGVIAATAL